MGRDGLAIDVIGSTAADGFDEMIGPWITIMAVGRRGSAMVGGFENGPFGEGNGDAAASRIWDSCDGRNASVDGDLAFWVSDRICCRSEETRMEMSSPVDAVVDEEEMLPPAVEKMKTLPLP
ncbi:hypothetical protein ACLOJK_015348 [Asimina triloba]